MKINIIEQHEPPHKPDIDFFGHLGIPEIWLFLTGFCLLEMVQNRVITYPILLLFGCIAVYFRYQRFVKVTQEDQRPVVNIFALYLDIILGLVVLVAYDLMDKL